MAGFDLSQYETVDTRIHKFWGEHKGSGRILTELVHVERDDTGRPLQYIVRAEIWIGDVMIASDYAEEVVGGSPVNRTSALENCSTSAIGRALANAGYSKEKFRASMTEMTKAERLKGTPEDDPFYTSTATGEKPRSIHTQVPGNSAHRQPISPAQIGKIKGLTTEQGLDHEQVMSIINQYLDQESQDRVQFVKELNKSQASRIIELLMNTTTVADYIAEQGNDNDAA